MKKNFMLLFILLSFISFSNSDNDTLPENLGENTPIEKPTSDIKLGTNVTIDNIETQGETGKIIGKTIGIGIGVGGGTVVGSIPGAIIGGIIGEKVGEKIGDKLEDKIIEFAEKIKQKEEDIKKKEEDIKKKEEEEKEKIKQIKGRGGSYNMSIPKYKREEAKQILQETYSKPLTKEALEEIGIEDGSNNTEESK